METPFDVSILGLLIREGTASDFKSEPGGRPESLRESA